MRLSHLTDHGHERLGRSLNSRAAGTAIIGVEAYLDRRPHKLTPQATRIRAQPHPQAGETAQGSATLFKL